MFPSSPRLHAEEAAPTLQICVTNVCRLRPLLRRRVASEGKAVGLWL